MKALNDYRTSFGGTKVVIKASGINFKVWFWVMFIANKTFLRVIVFTLIISLLNVAPAWSNICAQLFEHDVLSYLEKSNRENNHAISKNGTIEKDISELKEKNQIKINKIFDRITKEGAVSEKDIHRTAEELVILLYGKRDMVLRYFTKSKNERANESVIFQNRRKLMNEGLKSFVDSHTPSERITLWIKVKKVVRRLYQTQFWNIYQLPWVAPILNDKPMPEDLARKIIWDGVKLHQKEIMEYYEKQNPREFYASMRYPYTFVALSILAMNVSDAVISRNQAYEANSTATVTLPIELPSLNTPRDEILKRAIESHKIEFREAPTSAEILEIKAIIGVP